MSEHPDDDPGHPSLPRVAFYHAAGCHLCERAFANVETVRSELGFPLDVVDIGGDPELETRYRELLPVVEIDGTVAFTYYVPPDALRASLAARGA